ncbi:hypothetical protein MVEN_00012700 [Mycena venus]|uniref:Uncharacterized protein n=1 Tax=Mycena venus TaxID=2733690 RepID=A0A8H6Z3E4_9AGAR|nr:hypothetical protein MVEN_00012700 [Mycena venus]
MCLFTPASYTVTVQLSWLLSLARLDWPNRMYDSRSNIANASRCTVFFKQEGSRAHGGHMSPRHLRHFVTSLSVLKIQ